MSLIRVAKGPDAKAGSKSSFLNKKGREVEIRIAANRLKNMDKPTMRLNRELFQPMRTTVEIDNAQVDEMESATLISLTKYGFKESFGSSAILLTVKVSDWVPAASLMYAKTGVNAAKAKRAPKTFSKLVMIEAVIAPPRTPIISQGNLLFINTDVEDRIVVYSFPTLWNIPPNVNMSSRTSSLKMLSIVL